MCEWGIAEKYFLLEVFANKQEWSFFVGHPGVTQTKLEFYVPVITQAAREFQKL